MMLQVSDTGRTLGRLPPIFFVRILELTRLLFMDVRIANLPTAGAAGRFLAVWSSFTSAVFAFLGTEIVGVTVGECANPRKVIPRAIRLTFYRILLFYVVLVLLLGMIIPYNSPALAASTTKSTSAAASPFVAAIQVSGIEILPGILNGCILIFVLSAANSGMLHHVILRLKM